MLCAVLEVQQELDFIQNRDNYSVCGKSARNYFLKSFFEDKHFERSERVINYEKQKLNSENNNYV